MVGDTTLTSVQVEWIFLKTRMMKRYYFEKKRGMWMLEAINLREMEKGENEDFVEFYTRFVTDSVSVVSPTMSISSSLSKSKV